MIVLIIIQVEEIILIHILICWVIEKTVLSLLNLNIKNYQFVLKRMNEKLSSQRFAKDICDILSATDNK